MSMRRTVLAAVFFILSSQQDHLTRANLVVIHTELSVGIIVAYSTRLIPEGEPISDKEVEQLRSELLSTGLFTNVEVRLKPTEDREKVDVHITPTWHPDASRFRIGEIAFEGFKNLDAQQVRVSLQRRGIEQNSLLLNCSLLKLRNSLFEAIEEIYGDKEAREDLEEQVSASQFKIVPIERNRFQLIVFVSD